MLEMADLAGPCGPGGEPVEGLYTVLYRVDLGLCGFYVGSFKVIPKRNENVVYGYTTI